MRRVHLLALLGLTALAACTEEKHGEVDVCENFAITMATLDRFGQAVDTFGTTEVVRLQHTAQNLTDREQTVYGAYVGCSPPFSVFDADGNDVYADPRDPVFACAAVITPFQIDFKPGETKTYVEDWNTPRNDEPRNLSAGNYVATYHSHLGKCGPRFDQQAAFTLQ